MLCSDAQQDPENNIDTISDEVVLQIEKELMESPYDTNSLVFLLYKIPDTALQKLIAHQRTSKDVMATNLNLLYDWARNAKVNNNNWKHEFVEALLICQLFGIAKKLGLHIPSLIRYYQPDNLGFTKYINPMKKCLYKICESIDSNNLVTLKRTIIETFKIEVAEYESCELVLLKLMSENFITVDIFHSKKASTSEYNVTKLLQIIKKLPGLDAIASEVEDLQTKLNDQTRPIASSSPTEDVENNVLMSQMKASDFNKELELWNDIEIDENGFTSDNKKGAIKINTKSIINNSMKDIYKIKNKDRIGVCLILNIENFYLSQASLEDPSIDTVYDKRLGSTCDKFTLKHTMSSLKFKVITADDLDHIKMLDKIKETVKYDVIDTDSIFMLCIMSHGVKDHIIAADCVKVNVDKIKNILDSEDAKKLRGLPKILIIQACQVNEKPQKKLVADSPKPYLPLPKTDFLTFWATATGYEAYRDEEKGSIFIQVLCRIVKENGKKDHVYDLFTKVNKWVSNYCKRKGILQVSEFKVSLTKSLYFYIPE